jgi:hypothetical protein
MIQESKSVLPTEVSIEMDDTSKEIVITVKDRGISIDMSINEKLFPSDGGTGLGLYVSKPLLRHTVADFGPTITIMTMVLHFVSHYP